MAPELSEFFESRQKPLIDLTDPSTQLGLLAEAMLPFLVENTRNPLQCVRSSSDRKGTQSIAKIDRGLVSPPVREEAMKYRVASCHHQSERKL